MHPLAQAQIDAHEHLAPQIAAAQKAHLVDVLEHFESDIAPLVAPFVQSVVDDPDTPDHIKALLAPLTAPQHFGESIIIGIAVGSILSPVLTAIFDPVLVELAKHQWELAVGGPSIRPLGGRPVSPDLLAAAALKGVITEQDGASQASQSGTSADAFRTMFETAGQSIGLAEALLLLRRNQITPAIFRAIVQYSNINPKFYDLPEKLRYAPPTVGEAVTGALKHHLDPAVAAEMVGHAGVDPANFDWLLASAGRPLALEETLHLWNRGEVDETFVRQTIAQSDINPDYTEAALKLRHYFPPPRSIVPMLRSGAITEAQARRLLGFYGVDQEWSDAFVAEATHTSSTTVKELSSSQVTRMYSNRLIDRPTAQARLTALKYPPADATLLLDFADDARHERVLNATINKVGTLYVAHKLSKADATAALHDAAVPAAAQHDLFTLWDIQRTANVHLPSPAMIVAAGRRRELSPAEVKVRLNQLGIANTDLHIFVADGWPPSKPLDAQAAAHAVVAGLDAWPGAAGGPAAPPKRLTVVQISQLFTAGTIGVAEAKADLIALGYSATSADQLISTFTPPKVPVP